VLPATEINSRRYHDGALVQNNPTLIALREAEGVWATGKGQNLVLSLGCGIMRPGASRSDDAFSCCKVSYFESLSAKKQHDQLLSHGHSYTRLDPILDMDDVGLDCYEAIPSLQESFRATLREDRLFAEMLRSAAFDLTAALYYLRISTPTWNARLRRYSVLGVIRPREPSRHLVDLRMHPVFGTLYFVVNGRKFTSAMPKTVSIWVQTLDTRITVMLANGSYSAPILRKPLSVLELLEAQETFHCRSGTRKRRMSIRRALL
jgi:hypothetical protein